MSTCRALTLIASILAAAAMAACGSSDAESESSSSKSGPIVIGAAVDNTSYMKPGDQPPLAAAKLAAERINKAGGIHGRKIEFKVLDTRLDPAKTLAAATQLVESDKADILWVTCDVDLSTPAIQLGLQKGLLTVAPCIGTDQMGPKRFGEQGKLAFSFGNVAQDEGAAMAQMAIDKGWKTASVVTDEVLVYTKNVCQSFAVKFQELGGTLKSQETFTQGDGTIGGVVSKVNRANADVDAICTIPGKDMPAFVTGLRGLGDDTPLVGPWGFDGTYWLPKSPKVANNLHFVTYASVHGDDPSKAIRDLAKQLTDKGAPPATGGFITGADTVETLAHVIDENGGSTDGAELAKRLEALKGFKTSISEISFSPELHSVFGREYRVLDIENGKVSFDRTIKADKPVTLPGAGTR